MTPPGLLRLGAYGGDWPAYEEAVAKVFHSEIAQGLRFRGLRVGCRRLPETAGRWFSYWRLVQNGPVEEERLPDLRRCERIHWVRWAIENGSGHPEIDEWRNTRGGETNTLPWYREEYLVVLSERRGYWLLKTAYCTDREHTIRKLRRDRDAFRRTAAREAPKS